MSYFMTQTDYSFFISEKDYEKLCDDLAEKLKRTSLYWITSYKDKNELIKACKSHNIEKVFSLCRWRVEENVNEYGPGIYDIIFKGHKYGDDSFIFDAIAPYVRDGSYIDMVGEDNSLWRWSFVNGKMKKENGLVVYESTSKYIISCRWCSNCESGQSILGIAFDKQEAKDIMNKYIKEEKQNSWISNIDANDIGNEDQEKEYIELINENSWTFYEKNSFNEKFTEVTITTIN